MTRQEAIETLRANYPDKCYESLRNAVDIAIESLEAEPIKHGKWIRDAENFGKYYCSECGFSYIPIGVPKDNFCPNCGSDNRKVGE